MECRHGVRWRSTKVWNQNCTRCRAEEDAFEYSTNQLNRILTEKARAGYFEQQAWLQSEQTGHDPGFRKYWDDVRTEASVYWSEIWTYRRHLGIERRRMFVKGMLSMPVVLPQWLELLPPGLLTPKQQEACVYVFGYELTIREAAREIDVSRHAIEKRLAHARIKVESHYFGTPLPKRGRPRKVDGRTKAAREYKRLVDQYRNPE